MDDFDNLHDWAMNNVDSDATFPGKNMSNELSPLSKATKQPVKKFEIDGHFS